MFRTSVLLLNSMSKLIHNWCTCTCKLIIKTLWLHTTVSLFLCFNPLLTTWPGGEHGSRFTRGLFAEHSSSSASDLFLFFFSFVGDQTKTSTQPSLGRALNHENSNVYLPKAFATHENITVTVFFIVSSLCVQYIFSWFYWSIRFEAKNVLEHARITSSVGKY